MPVDNDRILCLVIYDSAGNPVQVIITVYLPFHQTGNKEQTELFIETTLALQGVIDKYGGLAPTMYENLW